MYIKPSNVDQVNRKLNLNWDLMAIIDPRLGSKYPVDEYKQVLDIALHCTTYDRNDRPNMQVSIHTQTHTHSYFFTHLQIHLNRHTHLDTYFDALHECKEKTG